MNPSFKKEEHLLSIDLCNRRPVLRDLYRTAVV
jgi:hypothetical protein